MAKVTLIGSGRAATALGGALSLAGHGFVQVWGRTEANANTLAGKLKATAVTDLSALSGDADVYLIAVKDDAISEVASQIKIGTKIVAHTSGIKSKDLLRSASPNYGIFYPFVSMTKESDTDFRASLLMIEGSNQHTIAILSDLAATISGNVKMVEENQRQSLHLAAVFAHNFTNHFYTIAEKILYDKGLKFDDLRPLIASHIANVQRLSPATLQTGPAIRHDSTTIDAHLHLLGQNIELKQLYLAVTAAIQHRYKDRS
jgi:predicted short-subunit dehydrogenase-like oxidoreductase (DUF2520 family)